MFSKRSFLVLGFLLYILSLVGCAGPSVRDFSRMPYNDRLTLATIHRQSGEVELAKAVLKRAIEQYPDRPEASIRLGDILFLEDDLQDAADSYQAAVDAGSSDPVMLNNYAWVMTNMGRHGSALSLIERAVNLAPVPLYPYLDTRAMVLRALGNYREALKSAELALALTPDRDEKMRRHLEKLISDLKNTSGQGT